jgi:hypothetical protein
MLRMLRSRAAVWRISAPAAAALALACGGDKPTAPDGTATVPSRVQEFTGNRQAATVGTTLGSPFVVEVLNAKGQPVGGVTVRFAVTAGGGTVSPEEAVTNSSGQARTTLALGPSAGAQTVTAAVERLPPVLFTATASAGPATQLVSPAAPPALTGTVGAALTAPVVLRVVDALGNGVAGVTLVTTPAAGSGSFAAATPTTDVAGEVRGIWTLGTRAGAQRLVASVANQTTIPPLTLSAVGEAGPPDSIGVVQGGGQTGDAGTALPTPVVARVADAYGNPVRGAEVTFSASAGGGALTPAKALTDSSGRAAATFTLGAQAGAQGAQAAVAAAGRTLGVSVQATAVAPSPATMWGLDHRVVDAEFSGPRNRIVTISANPSRLNVVDPDGKVTRSVDLPQVPLSVSVSPDGSHAAVSHDAWVSYVDLATATLVRSYPVPTVGGDVVLAGNGYAFVYPRSDQWVDVQCINLATGVVTAGTWPGPYAGGRARLAPGGEYIYATVPLSPDDFEKYDIRTGRAIRLYDSPYHGEHQFGGNLWIADDGSRLFARSGKVFRASTVRSEDMVYAGSFTGLGTVQAAVQLAGSSRIYVLGTAAPPPNYWFPDPVAAPDVRVYDAQFLTLRGSARLPGFRVPPEGSGTTHQAAGRYLFANATGTRLYALVQAPGASGLQQDWAVAVFDAADLP